MSTATTDDETTKNVLRSERKFSEFLEELLGEFRYMSEEDLKQASFDTDEVRSLQTLRRLENFEAGGYLTREAGFVLTFEDGTEFQVTVKLARGGQEEDEDDEEEGE